MLLGRTGIWTYEDFVLPVGFSVLFMCKYVAYGHEEAKPLFVLNTCLVTFGNAFNFISEDFWIKNSATKHPTI